MSEKEALLSTKPIFATIVPSWCAAAQWRLILAHLQHSKLLGKNENKKNLFEWNVYFVRILLRFYTYSNNSSQSL